MNIMNVIQFDNTKKVHQEAQQFKVVDCRGKEKQLYKIGDRIITDNKVCAGGQLLESDNAVIIEVWDNNGYFNYMAEFNISKRKKALRSLRQKDIIKIGG